MKTVVGVIALLGMLAGASAASAQSRIILGDPPPYPSPVLFGPSGPAPECLVWNWQQYSYYNHCRPGLAPVRSLRARG